MTCRSTRKVRFTCRFLGCLASAVRRSANSNRWFLGAFQANSSISKAGDLTKVRTIQIFVVGEVEKPGAMNVSGLATAFSALYQAGGPTQRGSMRHVKVLDSSGKAKSIDLYRYFLSGDRSQDIPVKNGDTIFVPAADSRISVTGMVNRPAIYELSGETSLADAIEMAGRALPKAYSGRVLVTRWTGDKRRESFDIRLSDADALKKFMISNGDEIKVEQATEMVGNLVTLEGPVNRPGEYSVDAALTVSDLITRAGGLIGEEANLERGQIYRKGQAGQQEVIAFNVKFALAGDKSQNHALKPFDRVRLFAEDEITPDNRRITIEGAIRRAGQYIYREGMRLSDLVIKAQGASIDAADIIEIARVKEGNGSEIIRASLKAALADQNSPDNIVLQPLDRISVPARGDSMIEPEIVYLKGQVMRPGPYALKHRGERLSSLIERAGGLTGMALPTAPCSCAGSIILPLKNSSKPPKRCRMTFSARRPSPCAPICCVPAPRSTISRPCARKWKANAPSSRFFRARRA